MAHNSLARKSNIERTPRLGQNCQTRKQFVAFDSRYEVGHYVHMCMIIVHKPIFLYSNDAEHL